MSTNQLLCRCVSTTSNTFSLWRWFYLHFRYYAQGICNFGDLCIYSHDTENSIPIPENVCLFYLRSNCINGDECAKVHKSIFELISESNGTDEEALQSTSNNFYPDDSPYDNNTEGISFCVKDSATTSARASLLVEEADVLLADGSSNHSERLESDQGASAKLSYALVASSSQPDDDLDKVMATRELCTFYESNGFCTTPKCNNVHGNWCDLCGFYSLHPYNTTQRELHRQASFKWF